MDETEYICPSCGEEIVIQVDPTQGEHQEYVEDCPICCRAIVLRLEFAENGDVICQAYLE